MTSVRFKSIMVYFLYTLIVSLVLVEIILRLIPPFSTGNGGGIGRAWHAQYWHPINQQGYRDVEVTLNPMKKLLVSVGDSFTAGHGVEFNQTYTHGIRNALGDVYDVVNLGQNGSSTSRQLDNYVGFLSGFEKKPDVVIYQYFGNDIEDFVDTSGCYLNRSALSSFLTRYSYAYSLVDTIFLQKKFGKCYRTALKAAYKAPSRLEKHQAQIVELVSTIQSNESKVIFLVFPFLHNEAEILGSQSLYVEKLKALYQDFCRPGDWLYDVSLIAKSLDTSDRVASFMDAHPSSRLHELLANDLTDLVLSNSAADGIDGAIACKR